MVRPKVDRNNAIVAYRRANPGKSLADIADVFRIRRQAVWKILQRSKKASGAKL